MAVTLAVTRIAAVNADDIAEVKAAFAKYQSYNGERSFRLFDLFEEDATVKFLAPQAATQKIAFIRARELGALLKRKPEAWGSREQFEGVRFRKHGKFVQVTGTSISSETGDRSAFAMRYRKDLRGEFKIVEMTITARGYDPFSKPKRPRS